MVAEKEGQGGKEAEESDDVEGKEGNASAASTLTKPESKPSAAVETDNNNRKTNSSDENDSTKENAQDTSDDDIEQVKELLTKAGTFNLNHSLTLPEVCTEGVEGVVSISPDDLETEDENQENRPPLNLCLTNLETIKEGEILEFPPDGQTPIHGDVTYRSQLFFGDSQSELTADEEDGSVFKSDPQKDIEDDDDDGSVLSLPAELPPPPDGGWGWVIVLVSFLANLIVDGVAYSFSPFLDVFSEYFDEPKGKIAWISSLLAGMYLSVGPIVSTLTNKYGCRPVCISGAVIASIAYLTTVFANSVPYLMVTQGCIAGFGFGLIYLPAVVCVGYYFESKRALATGIAVCGSGVGTMIFPPLINLLIEHFGWRGANLIIAGIILNCCWMGALMRPLEVPKMKRKDLLHRLAEEKKIAMATGSFYGSNYMNVTNPDGTVTKKRVLNFDPGVHSHLNLSGYFTPAGINAGLPTIQESNKGGDSSGGSAGSVQNNSNTNLPQAVSPREDDKNSVPGKGDATTPATPTLATPTLATPTPATPEVLTTPRILALQKDELFPRNSSQPSINKHGGPVPKRGSVPNFERRMSKMDIVNQMKVIPATPEASYTNLRLLGSQDMRRSSAEGRGLSSASFVDPEAVALRQRRSSTKGKGVMLPPMSRQDIFYSGSIKNLNEFKSQASMLSYRESTFNLQNTSASRAVLEAFDVIDDQLEDEEEKKKCCPDDVCGPLREMMDFSLLKNPVFLTISVANMIGMLGFYTPFVYLPGAAIEKGIPKESATLLISIIGITNTIGRVLSGLIADIPRVNALWVNNLSIIFSGVCMFLTPFANSFGAFVAISVFFGFFVSAFIALTSIIIVDLIGLRLLTNAFGIVCIFRGVAGILGPPVAGSIYDATNSYDVSFYCSGILLFICAFLHCLIPCIQKYCSSCHEGPIRYTTNEEYLQTIPQEDPDNRATECNSPDAGEGIGIVFNIKPKIVLRERSERGSFSSVGSKDRFGRGDQTANV